MQIISFAANPTFNLCKSKMLDKTMDLFIKRLLNPVSHYFFFQTDSRKWFYYEDYKESVRKY